MLCKIMTREEYTAVPLDDPDLEDNKMDARYGSAFNYDSPFDFKSISRYSNASFPSKSYFAFSKQHDPSKHTAPDRDACLTSFVSALMLCLVYAVAVLTLPVTGWWTVRRLQQWQRLVVFRLGKALPPRGPGWTLVLPWVDAHQLVDLRNKSILVPPQQLLTCDGAVAELGAEVRYRVCDPHAFVGSCVDAQAALRSLAKTIMVNSLSARELAAMTRKAPETEEIILTYINSQLKDWGMEASSVKFSEVKVHKEPEQLSSVNPVLSQLSSLLSDSGSGSGSGSGGGLGGLGSLLGVAGGGGMTLVAGQPPLTASWLPPASAAPAEQAATPSPLAAATPAPLAADPETAAALRAAVARLPSGAAAAPLAAGVYRIETCEPAAVYHVIIAEGVREVREGAGGCGDVTPDVTVTLAAEDLRRLAAGTLSPLAAYSGGRVRVQGNVHLLMALGGLFRDGGAPGTETV